MALPSRLQFRAARESPEEEHYSGLHSVSKVPTACPSQLFRVWLCGKVWYQWNADSLSVALTPIFQTARSLPLCLFRLKRFHHIQNGGAGQEVFQGLGSFQDFDKRGCANAAPWPWQRPHQTTEGGGDQPLTLLLRWNEEVEKQRSSRSCSRGKMVTGNGRDEDVVDGERMEKQGKPISVVWMREEKSQKQSWADSVCLSVTQ